jgi:hypothetical protein
MNQLYLRKLHKTIGVVLVIFIFLQAGSGLFLSFEVSHSHANTDAITMPDKHEHENGHNVMLKEKAINPGKDEAVVRNIAPAADNHGDKADDRQGMLQLVHHGGGFIGSIYRILLASGFLFMAFSGALIFYLTRKAMRQ